MPLLFLQHGIEDLVCSSACGYWTFATQLLSDFRSREYVVPFEAQEKVSKSPFFPVVDLHFTSIDMPKSRCGASGRAFENAASPKRKPHYNPQYSGWLLMSRL